MSGVCNWQAVCNNGETVGGDCGDDGLDCMRLVARVSKRDLDKYAVGDAKNCGVVGDMGGGERSMSGSVRNREIGM